MSSKKMLRLIIVMAVLLVLVIVSYLLIDQHKQNQENAELEEQASLQLFSFPSENVNTIIFQTDEGDFKIEAVNGLWELTETDYPHDLKLNSYYVNTVCANMSSLKALRKFTVEADRLEGYGLAEPAAVTCYEGSIPHTLYVGSASATEEYYYVMLPGDDTVYGIDFTTGSMLRGSTFNLRSHILIPYHETEITGYSVKRKNDLSLILEKQDGLWHMREPLPDGNVNSATVNSMLTIVTRTEVDLFVEAQQGVDLSAYGLNDPDYTLEIQTDDESCVFQFAYDPKNNSMMYVLNQNNDVISAIAVSETGFLNTKPTELMTSKLLSVRFEDTTELEASIDGQHFTMNMEHEDGRYLLDGTDVAAINSNAFNMFKNLFDTMALMDYETMDLDADIPEDAEADCEFRFTLTDGSETVLTLVQSEEENLYWAFIDGSYTGLTVRRRALSGNTGVLEFYKRLSDIIDTQ